MKNPKFFIKLICTLTLIIFPFFIIKAQEITVNDSLDNKSYNNMIGWDLFSVNYSYSFFNKQRWSGGITTGIGLGYSIGIIRPYLKVTCADCDDWSRRRMGPVIIEIARIGPFIRYNYFKSNYLELNPYFSSFLITGYSDAFLPKPDLAVGAELSVFFGSDRLKFGAGLRLSTFFYHYSSNDPANDIVTGLFIRPLIIHYHF